LPGVLLVNLGTPDSPSPADVGRYLREFLADPRVVDLPRWLWLPLLYGIIVPLRRHRSAAAYGRIWQAGGSPLLINSRAIAARLAGALAGEAQVELAMRYGSPSVCEGLSALQSAGIRRLCVIPMYPQYSHTTTASVLDAVEDGLRKLEWQPEMTAVRDYYRHPRWAPAIAESIRRYQGGHGRPERLLFSLHGIPQRYVRQGDPYADQCRESVSAIRSELGVSAVEAPMTFQSRVGREPWLQPYTDQTLKELAEAGVRHVQVVCPGFAADCLETLEEIAMLNRELFQEHGGERLDYIPALNDSEEQIALYADLARECFAGDGGK